MARSIGRRHRRLLVDVADLKFEIGAAEDLRTGQEALPSREVGRAMAVAFENWCRRVDAARKAQK